MSATNRGAIRRESDFYKTPTETIDAFLDHFCFLINEDILEPCAGDGAIIKAIRARTPAQYITAIEIREEESANLLDLVTNHIGYNNTKRTDSPVIYGDSKDVKKAFAVIMPMRIDFTRKDYSKFPNIPEIIEETKG